MRRVSFALLAGLTALPSLASADIFNLYAAAKTDYVSGSGEVFDAFDASMGYGLEAGVEVLGIDFWGEFLAMGDSQFLASANLGFDLTVGGDRLYRVQVRRLRHQCDQRDGGRGAGRARAQCEQHRGGSWDVRQAPRLLGATRGH